MRRAPILLLGTLVAALCLGGCSKPAQRPVLRLGSLPHPGPFNLFVVADPEDLGTHQYRHSLRLGTSEVERGIIYTRRAGFLDLSHVRDTIDMTRYMRTELARALTFSIKQVDIECQDLTRYHVAINYPPWWNGMSVEERAYMLDELPLRLAQYLTWDVMNWHEIITWYGYKTMGLFSETKSAFTYEDTMSHVVGLRVADAALRRRSIPYDIAVTGALAGELEALQVVSKEEAIEAVEAAAFDVVDAAFDAARMIPPHREPFDPWLVPGWEPMDNAPPIRHTLPDLAEVRWRDCRGMLDVELESRIFEIGRIRADLDGRPDRINVTQFPTLLDAIRTSFDPEDLSP